MSESAPVVQRCPWFRFHPDTRKVFVFFVVMAVLIAVAKGTEDQSKSAARARNHEVRTIPLGTRREKASKTDGGSSPLVIEKVQRESRQ